MQRVPGKNGAVRSLILCSVVSCAALFVAGGPVGDTMASGRPHQARASARANLKVSRSASRDAVPATLLPPADDEGVQIRHLVAPGESFGAILRGQGLSDVEAQAWEQAASAVFDVGTLEPRHPVLLTFTRDQGHLRACDYEIDRYALLSMRLAHGQIQARLKAMPQLTAVRGVSGRVEASLATSAGAAGVPARMVSELADLFGWQVDLANDVRPGDSSDCCMPSCATRTARRGRATSSPPRSRAAPAPSPPSASRTSAEKASTTIPRAMRSGDRSSSTRWTSSRSRPSSATRACIRS